MSKTNNIDVKSLKKSINIVDVIGKYVDLKKVGYKTYKANCPHPEHNDKNPSFYVKEDDQYFNCFSCSFKGDVITFIEEMEGINFIEAVDLLIKDGNLDYEKLKKEKCTDKENLILYPYQLFNLLPYLLV